MTAVPNVNLYNRWVSLPDKLFCFLVPEQQIGNIDKASASRKAETIEACHNLKIALVCNLQYYDKLIRIKAKIALKVFVRRSSPRGVWEAWADRR